MSKTCPECKNSLDESAFSWYGNVCNGCGKIIENKPRDSDVKEEWEKEFEEYIEQWSEYFGMKWLSDKSVKLRILKDFIYKNREDMVNKTTKILADEVLIKCPCEDGDCEHCKRLNEAFRKIDSLLK